MDSIPSGEFLKRIGEYLERASKGEQLLITRYGRPYVLVGPVVIAKGDGTPQ